AHATAPGANIVLDVSSTSFGSAITAAEAAAIARYPGAVFSQSFGAPDGLIQNPGGGAIKQADAVYAAGIARGDTFSSSAGDCGASGGTNLPMGSFPATSPNNTGVAGTQGFPYVPDGSLTDCLSSIPFSCTTGLAAFHGPCAVGGAALDCVPDGYGGEQV